VLAALLTSNVDFWMSFQEMPQHYHQFAGIVPVTPACGLPSSRIMSRTSLPADVKGFRCWGYFSRDGSAAGTGKDDPEQTFCGCRARLATASGHCGGLRAEVISRSMLPWRRTRQPQAPTPA
jgi:hypothetical protein